MREMSDDLICPHCGHINHDYEYYESPPETDIEFQCTECEKDFTYQWASTVYFTVLGAER